MNFLLNSKMPIEYLTVKTNCVIWKNILLPHPKKNLKSPIFCFDGLKWHFDISCTWYSEEEVWNFGLKCTSNPGSVSPIVVPYVKTAQKYVRLASTITNTKIWRSSLSTIIGPEDIITVMFYLTPQFLMPPDFKDVAVTNTLVVSNEKISDEDKKRHLCLEGLSEDIEQLFNKDGYADATLKCDSKSFSVHRNILAARSTVFASMFKNDMSEKNTGMVEIVDLDPNVLEQFLLYLYCGKVLEMCMDTALKLYKTADKYDVYSLKQLCVSYILEHMSKDVVCDVLLMADRADNPEFLDKVTSAVANISGYLNSSEWEEFAAKCPAVAVKVYSKYLKRHSPGLIQKTVTFKKMKTNH